VVTQLERSLDAKLEALQKEETLLKEHQEASATVEARLTRWRKELEETATKQSFIQEEIEEEKRSLARQNSTMDAMEHVFESCLETCKKTEARLVGKEREVAEALAAAEKLQLDQRAGAQRIANWAGKASSALVPLGMSPIEVAEPLDSITTDTAAEHLRSLDQTLGARLKEEGRELCRVVVEHVLTCFRSHDPDVSLAPIIEGPVADAEAAAREGV